MNNKHRDVIHNLPAFLLNPSVPSMTRQPYTSKNLSTRCAWTLTKITKRTKFVHKFDVGMNFGALNAWFVDFETYFCPTSPRLGLPGPGGTRLQCLPRTKSRCGVKKTFQTILSEVWLKNLILGAISTILTFFLQLLAARWWTPRHRQSTKVRIDPPIDLRGRLDLLYHNLCSTVGSIRTRLLECVFDATILFFTFTLTCLMHRFRF